MKRLLRHGSPLALLFLLAPAAFAESRLVFPRVTFQGGRFSGIAIVNPTAASVEVTLRAYRSDGSLFSAAGASNPRTATIPPGSQYSAVATEIFAPPASIAESATPTLLWVEAASPADGLTGFFLDGSTALDLLDGSNLAGAGTDLVLPLVENTPPSATEVSIVNPDPASPATVTLDFFRTDGSVVATRSTVLAKLGALLGPLSSHFPLAYDEVAAVRLRSDRPVVAFGYVSRSSPASLVTFAAQNVSLPARILYFPQLAEGSDWTTAIAIHNFSSAQILVTLTAYQADGTLFGPPAATHNPVTRTIEAGGILRAPAAALFGFPASPLQVGWIKAEASDTAIHGYVEYGAGSNRALVSAQLEPTTRAIFSQQATAPPYYTGLAILNSGSLTANVEIVSSSRTSALLGKTQRVLKPRQREALLVEQWVPSAAGVTGGSLYVKSDLPVVVTQLFGTVDLSALANVPPQAVPASFSPGSTIPAVRVSPPLAVVETGKSQRFSSSGATGLTWAIDGTGSETTRGSVTSDGLYTAPAVAPQGRTLTVKASNATGGLSAGASVDVIERGSLSSGLTQVTAVAYLASLQRFFLAEQQLLSSAPTLGGGRVAATGGSARISEQLASGTLRPFFTLDNDAIAKMLPYQDAAANWYLLIAGGDSGSIYRLAIADKKLVAVATGLKQPSSMAFDPVTGNLLVSEAGANQITVVRRRQFDPTAAQAPDPPLASRPDGAGSGRSSITVAGPRGVAYDTCTGATYVTTADGSLREYLGTRERDVLPANVRLDRPSQILVLHREGVSTCREGVTLLVCEAGQLAQVDPVSGARLVFLGSTQNALDVVFLPKGNPFTPNGEESVGVAEAPAGAAASRVAQVAVGGIYQETVPQPPTLVETGGTGIPFRDPRGDTFATARSSAGSAPDILSVEAHGVEGTLVMSVTFAGPVAAASAGLPASITGFVDFDTMPGTGGGSHADAFSAFGQPSGLGVDAHVDLSTGVLHRAGGPGVPVTMTFLDTTLTLQIPTVLAGATQSRIAVVVGNRTETTDVAPNSGFINMSVDPTGNRLVQFDRAASSGLESQASAPIDVRLSAPAQQPVTVAYAASGGSAASGADYRLASGTLTLLPGETSKAIPLTVVDNAATGPNRTVRIALSGPTGAALGPRTTHTYTILDDDAAPTVQFLADAASGANSASTVSIPVSLSSASSQTATVQYGVTGGSAVSGTDYRLVSGTLTFAPGEVAKRIPLTVLDTGPTGTSKTVVVSLSGPAGATLGSTSTHTYTIIGRRPEPIVVQFEASASSGLISVSDVSIPLSLAGTTQSPVSVAYDATGGTAVRNVDYVLVPGTALFAPGTNRTTIRLAVLDNPAFTGARTVVITLRNPVGGSLGTRTTHTYTILKSSSTLPSVSFKSSTSTFPWFAFLAPIDLQLSGPAATEVLVGFKVSGTAKEGTFAIFGRGLVGFPPGETAASLAILMLPILEESPPASATVVLELIDPQGATLGAITTHTLTITYPEEAPR